MSRPFLIAIIGFATASVAVGLALSLGLEDQAREALSPARPVIAPAPPLADLPVLPSFDVVRIGESGNAVLAGRALPKSEVVILDAGRELGRVSADERGEWVFVPSLPLGPGARSLTLMARGADGGEAWSEAPVTLVVPEAASAPVLALKPLPEGGARLLQGPGGDAGPLAVELVDRDPAGQLFVAGRAQANGVVHLYLDNKFVGRIPADGDGSWKLAVKGGKGRVLRADMVGERGKVRARAEIVLDIAESQSLAVAPGEASPWHVRRPVTGGGSAETIIYRGGGDQARDPDRTYPGQVFQVPGN